MILSLTVLSVPALADQACEPASIAFSAPEPAATGVPVDAAPLIAFQGGCGDTVLVSITADGVVLPVYEGLIDVFDLPNTNGVYVLEPDVTLDDSTRYTVSVDLLSGVETWTFETGSDVTVPVAREDVVLTIAQIEGSREDQQPVMDIQGSVAAPAGAIVIRHNGTERLLLEEAGPFDLRVVQEGSSACLTPSLRNEDGTWTDGEEVCGSLTPDPDATGCATGSAPQALFVLPLLALFRRRRLLRG